MKSNAYHLFLWYIICLIILGGLILGTFIVSGDIVWTEKMTIFVGCALVVMCIITLAVRAAYKKAMKQEVQQEAKRCSVSDGIPSAQEAQRCPASDGIPSTPKAQRCPVSDGIPSEPKPAPVQKVVTIEDVYPPRVLDIARYIVRIQRCVISDIQAEFNISRTDVLAALKTLEHASVIVVNGSKRLVIPKDQSNLEEYLTAYMPEMQSKIEEMQSKIEEILAPWQVDLHRLDPMFAEVARYVVSHQEGSVSRLQRAFEIGFNRAGKLSDQLEAAGIVGPSKGPKGRDVLIQDLDQLEQLLAELGVN